MVCLIASYCFCLQICNPQCSEYSECIDCQFSLSDDTVVKIGNANCSDECQEGISKNVSVGLISSSSVEGATVNGDLKKGIL